MSRRGPMSIEDHRAWVAKYHGWTPPKPRPGEKLVEHVIGQLATALERPEVELVNDVIARVGFNEPERARVEEWARQALTVVVLAAERAGSSGTRLSDNVLFHEIALRWSPAYSKALERGPGSFPSEMRRQTLEAARDDIKASGLRLQELFVKAAEGVTGWYKTRMTAKGRRVVLRGKPLRGEALKEARAVLGLPPLERIHGRLLRADDPSRKVYGRIETDDPVLLEAQRGVPGAARRARRTRPVARDSAVVSRSFLRSHCRREGHRRDLVPIGPLRPALARSRRHPGQDLSDRQP